MLTHLLPLAALCSPHSRTRGPPGPALNLRRLPPAPADPESQRRLDREVASLVDLILGASPSAPATPSAACPAAGAAAAAGRCRSVPAALDGLWAEGAGAAEDLCAICMDRSVTVQVGAAGRVGRCCGAVLPGTMCRAAPGCVRRCSLASDRRFLPVPDALASACLTPASPPAARPPTPRPAGGRVQPRPVLLVRPSAVRQPRPPGPAVPLLPAGHRGLCGPPAARRPRCRAHLKA